MSYRTITVTSKPQPLFVGQPLNKAAAGLGLGWTLANNDQLNPVYVSTTPGLKSTDSDAIQVAPLGSIPIDPTLTSYIVSAGPSVQCFLMPGGGTWAPSPAQVAAQINALGLAKDTTLQGTTGAVNGVNTTLGTPAQKTDVNQVNTTLGAPAQDSIRTGIPNNIAVTGTPIINNSTLIAPQVTGQVIAAGATFTFCTKASVTRPTFEVFIFISNGGGADTAPFSQVDMAWFDSNTAQQIASDKYYFVNGTVNGGGYNYHGIGVSHADQLTFSITNKGSTSTTYSVILMQNGKPNPVSTELWNMIFATAGSPGTFANFGGNDPASNVLLNMSATTATGADNTRLMATYYGRQVNISVHTGSGLADCFIHVEYPPAIAAQLAFLNSQVVTWGQTDGNGSFFRQIQLPNLPVQVRVTNQNASSRTIEIDVQGA